MNNKLESIGEGRESQVEAGEKPREVSPEAREALDYQGAGLLEEPKNGSFVSALQLFVDWVKSVVADDK